MSLIAEMFRTPGAERVPADWAARFCAHQGLAAAASLLLLAVLPAGVAVAVLLAGYAAWEAGQYLAAPRRGWALAADCLLDWTAWAAMALAVAWWPVPGVLASAAILTAGIWRRS